MESPSSFAALFNRQRPNPSKKDNILGAFKTCDNNSPDTSMSSSSDTFASLFTKRTMTETKRKGELVLHGPNLPVPKKPMGGNTEFLLSLQETKTFPIVTENRDLSNETTSENTVRFGPKTPPLNVPIKTELTLETTNQGFLKPSKNNIPNRILHTEGLNRTVQETPENTTAEGTSSGFPLFRKKAEQLLSSGRQGTFPVKTADDPPKGMGLFHPPLPKENMSTPRPPTTHEINPNSLKEEKMTKEVLTESVRPVTTPDVVPPVWSEKNDLMETETTLSRVATDETPSSPWKNDSPGPKFAKTVTEIQDQMVTGTTYVQNRVEDLTESLCNYEEKLKELSVKLALLNNEVLILNTPLAKILFEEKYHTTHEE